jgi:polyhydroxyalkanoate synthesis repressor PhaR
MDRKLVIIKKYENRRLYNTATSRYVNLDEVAEMIRQGENVQVVDASTGEDLTRLILTQIIVDHAKTQNSTFPLEMLREMVVATGMLGQNSMLKYMKDMAETYQSAYRAFTPPGKPFDFMQGMGTTPRPPDPEEPPLAETEPPRPPGAKESEMRELKRRIEELEALVAKSDSKGRPRKQSPRRPAK